MANYAIYISLYFLFCSVVAAFTDVSHIDPDYDDCATPEGQSGKCVIINQCPPLLNLLKERPILPEHQVRLKEANCGFQGIRPKVCCPLYAIHEITPSTQQPHISSTEQPHASSSQQPSSVPTTEPPIPEPPLSKLLPSLQECGYFIDDLVLFGEDTQLDGYPWMVLLQYQTPSGRGFHCGGVLINDRYVLTAAHCIYGRGIDPLTWKLVGVRLGEYDRDTDPDCNSSLFAINDCCCTNPVVDVEIEKSIVHEQYHAEDHQQYNDIALLRLVRNITFSDFIRPICLQPVSNLRNSLGPGNSAVIGGWGVNTLRSNSNKKRTARMEIRDNAKCESAYAKKGLKLREDQICAFAAEGLNACSGDSGGALTNDVHRPNSPMNYYALGIMSIANPICGLNEYPVIYTKVEKYIPWIIERLNP